MNRIVSVRRLSCALAAFLLIAPAVFRLAAADSDAEARRCAIACGHAMKAGAACCPMRDAGSGTNPLTMSPCTPDDSPAAAPVAAGQPAILIAIEPLGVPEPGAPAFALPPAAPRAPAARPLDHVPLLLS